MEETMTGNTRAFSKTRAIHYTLQNKFAKWRRCTKRDFRCTCVQRIKGQPRVQCTNIIKVGEIYFDTGNDYKDPTQPKRICFHCANSWPEG